MNRVHTRPGALRASGRCVLAAAGAAALWSLAPVHVLARQAADPFVMSCQAMPARTSVADLRARHGAGNVVDAPAVDRDDTPGTVLYPSVPERRAEIQWADAARTRLARFSVRERRSAWHTAEGLKTGLAIADVELLNGRSFLLHHFEYPGGGYVLSWTGGKFERASDDACLLVARLMPPPNQEFTTLEWRLVEAIAGSPDVASDDRKIKPYKAAVVEIGLEWRE